MEIDYTRRDRELAENASIIARLNSTTKEIISAPSIASGTSIVVKPVNGTETITQVGCCAYLNRKPEYIVGIVEEHPSFYGNPKLSEEWIREMGKMFDFSVEKIPEEESSKFHKAYTKYDSFISEDAINVTYISLLVLKELTAILNKYIGTTIKEHIRELVQDKEHRLAEVDPNKGIVSIKEVEKERGESFINAIEFCEDNMSGYPLALLGNLSRALFPYLLGKRKVPIRDIRGCLTGIYNSMSYISSNNSLIPINYSKLKGTVNPAYPIFVEILKNATTLKKNSSIYTPSTTRVLNMRDLPIDKKGLEKEIDDLVKLFKMEIQKLDRREVKPHKVFYKIKTSYNNCLIPHTLIRCLWEPHVEGDSSVFPTELYFQARELYPNIDPYFILGMVMAGKRSSYGSPWGGDKVFIKPPNPNGESNLDYYIRKVDIQDYQYGVINSILRVCSREAISLVYSSSYPVKDLATLRMRIDEKLKKFLTS